LEVLLLLLLLIASVVIAFPTIVFYTMLRTVSHVAGARFYIADRVQHTHL
jgi:hypothetical protein